MPAKAENRAVQLRNFKLTLEYEGTNFCGWQTQSPDFRTAQSHVEKKLEKIFKKKIHCHASGRTDSGVHALAQVAHFKAHTRMQASLIQKALNSFLDKDICIVKCQEMPLHFHAQKDVKTKTYRYTILNRQHPSALWADRALFYPGKLNLTAMRQVAKELTGKHDFKSFQSASKSSRIKNTVRTLEKVAITREKDLIHISITSDGFLYKMVRNIIGVLMAVGSGRWAADNVLKLLKSKDRKTAPRTAASHGLCLMSVRY